MFSEIKLIKAGTKFNEWTCLGEYEIRGVNRKTAYWKCRCSCGEVRFVHGTTLRNNKSKSCGCIKAKHNMRNSSEYNSWRSMKKRCYQKTDISYPNYGGRGIRVCDEWKDSFKTFYKDMGPKPSKNHSLERINNNGNYYPENCRWATSHEQCINKRNNNYRVGVIKKDKCYVALMQHNLERLRLGTFSTELEAATAYDNKCEELHGYRPNHTIKENIHED